MQIEANTRRSDHVYKRRKAYAKVQKERLTDFAYKSKLLNVFREIVKCGGKLIAIKIRRIVLEFIFLCRVNGT